MKKQRLALVISLLIPTTQVLADEYMIYVENSRIDNAASDTYEPGEISLSPSSDAGEALRNIPGVSGIRMGGHGIDPIIRGQSQTRINILLDGAYIHGGCPNRMDPPTAYSAMDSYESITVIKGSQSVLYGSGGSGGTVLFERDKPLFTEDKPYQGSFSAGLKNNSDSFETAIDVAAGNRSGYLRGLASYNQAGNYKDGGGNSVFSAYESKEGTVILGFNPDASSNLEFSYTANRERDTFYAGAGMDSPFSNNDMLKLKYTKESPTGFFDSIKAEFYSSDVDHLMDNFSLRPLTAPMKMSAPSSSDTVGGRLMGTVNADTLNWTFGLDHQSNQRNADRYTGATLATLQSVLWPNAELDQTGLFAEVEFPLGEIDTIKAGLRYDHIKASITEANRATFMPGSSPAGLYAMYYANPTTSSTENNVGGFINLTHKLSDNSSLFAAISRSVRTADATERYIASNSGMAASRWVGNSNLEPEKHHQIELGYQRNQTSWDLDLSLFYNRVSDYILRDRAHAQTGILLADNATIYRNIDARLYGFEAGVNVRWSNHWSSVFTLAYVNAENTSDNRTIAQTPPLEGTINLEYNKNDWRIGGLVRAQDRQTRVEDDIGVNSGLDVGKTSGWAVLDLFGSYEGMDDLTLSAGINNALDNTYAYHVNRAGTDPFNPTAIQVNEPGREFWLKVKASF